MGDSATGDGVEPAGGTPREGVPGYPGGRVSRFSTGHETATIVALDMGRIMYGGSVNPDNIRAIMAQPSHRLGALVGGPASTPVRFVPGYAGYGNWRARLRVRASNAPEGRESQW